MKVVCKPIDSWPRPYLTTRKKGQFSAFFSNTMTMLRSELRHLGADTVVLEIDVKPSNLRNDGWPYANANVPPPVKLSFNSKHGPLTYATDTFAHWHDNVRAIALGLEALRKVDRYGITDAGQQYKGWAALPAGSSALAHEEALVELSMFLFDFPNWLSDTDNMVGGKSLEYWVKRAQQQSHPDSETGSHEQFLRVQELAKVLA